MPGLVAEGRDAERADEALLTEPDYAAAHRAPVEPRHDQRAVAVSQRLVAPQAERAREFQIGRFRRKDERRLGTGVRSPLQDGVSVGVLVGDERLEIPKAVAPVPRQHEFRPRALQTKGAGCFGGNREKAIRSVEDLASVEAGHGADSLGPGELRRPGFLDP